MGRNLYAAYFAVLHEYLVESEELTHTKRKKIAQVRFSQPCTPPSLRLFAPLLLHLRAFAASEGGV